MSSKAGSPPEQQQSSLFRPPFAPRPGLFYALLGLQGIWVTVLLIVYFTTVYPQQKRPVAPASPVPSTQSQSAT